MTVGPRSRSWLWGAVAGIGLVAAACLSVGLGLIPGVPLFDGLAPPAAYRWVRPPPELRNGNKAPDATAVTVTLTATGSDAANIATADEQVMLTLPAGAFGPAEGQVAVRIGVEPLDPATAPPPPVGLVIEGNVYRITAAYVPSGAATAAQPVLLGLRYPVDATKVIRSGGASSSSWEVLPTTLESAALSVATTTKEFGLFAAAGTDDRRAGSRRTPTWAYVAAGLALLAVGVPALRKHRPERSPPRRLR